MRSTRPLPPLVALRAFEAAARHLSFSLAAQLASGALVQAVPDAVLDDPRIGWWLVTPRTVTAESEAVAALRDWLTRAAAAELFA